MGPGDKFSCTQGKHFNRTDYHALFRCTDSELALKRKLKSIESPSIEVRGKTPRVPLSSTPNRKLLAT